VEFEGRRCVNQDGKARFVRWRCHPFIKIQKKRSVGISSGDFINLYHIWDWGEWQLPRKKEGPVHRQIVNAPIPERRRPGGRSLARSVFGAHAWAGKSSFGSDARRTVAAMEAIDQSAGVADQLAIELRFTIDEIVADYIEIERRIVELRIEGYEVEQIAERAARSRRTVERVLHGSREDSKRAL
jgi:hypothetical protein